MIHTVPRSPLVALVALGCAVLPARHDLSDQPIGPAVDGTLDLLEATYAFTGHKELDWDAARDTLGPIAHAAEGDDAIDAVVRRLVPLLPDAHVRLFNDDPARDLCPEARGSLGIQLSDLDDGRVIVVASEHAALQPGDTVVTWAGRPIAEARAETPLHCFPLGTATTERRRDVALRLLVRAPAGGSVTVGGLRGALPLSVELEAVPDERPIREVFDIEPPTELLGSRTLPGGLAYIRIGWEETWITETRFQRVLAGFDDAPALVIDLRDNDGGMEHTAANIAGFFTLERSFYETVTFLDNRTGAQVVMSEVWVEPQELYWDRPVRVLVDGDTVSSGEGLAMLLARAPQVEVVGFEGTAASFGSTGSSIALPGGWTLEYPGGRSLDAEGRIQLDSDATLTGGVSPTIRVPWTEDTRVRRAAGEDVVLEHAFASWGTL